MKLTKGMYGTQLEPRVGLFGLHCGQLCSGLVRIFKNAGWYNKRGERLGWGDLSQKNLREIFKEIPDGEIFIILGETDAFWNFVTKLGVVGSLCKTKSRIQAPGIDYVFNKCRAIVARNKLYYVINDGTKERDMKSERGAWKVSGLKFMVINRKTARALIEK